MFSSKTLHCLEVLALVVLSFLLTTASGAPVNSIQEDQPWLTPCSLDRDANTNVPVDVIRGLTVPRIPEWDDPSKFAFETLNGMTDTEDLVEDLTKYMVRNHFGGNGSHLADLRQLVLEDFNLDVGNMMGKTMDSLSEIYEMLVRATIFLEVMREDLASEPSHLRTQKEEKMAMALDTLARGGWDGEINRESGFYQLLCKLYSYLAANGRFMFPSHLDKEVVPSYLRNPKNRAERHNRDFVVLRHMQNMFSDMRKAFVELHTGTKRRNINATRQRKIMNIP